MTDHVNLDQLRAAVREGRYTITQHARQRKAQRKITWKEVLEVIQHGKVIEEHPKEKPLPKVLLMRKVRQDEPLYVSIAYDEARHWAHIITVHWMDPAKWVDPWTRR
jgi:hypothetical protein